MIHEVMVWTGGCEQAPEMTTQAAATSEDSQTRDAELISVQRLCPLPSKAEGLCPDWQ